MTDNTSAGPYAHFVELFSDCLSGLVLNSGMVIIVRDFNIHVDTESNSVKVDFSYLSQTYSLLFSCLRPCSAVA